WMAANVARSWSTPGRFYRNAFATLGAQQQVNYEGDLTDIDYHASIGGTLLNYMNAGGFVIHHPSNYDERLTRGGPTVIHYGYNLYSTDFSTDSRKRIVGNFTVQRSTPRDNSEGGRMFYAPGVTVKPSSRLLISLSPLLDLNNT